LDEGIVLHTGLCKGVTVVTKGGKNVPALVADGIFVVII
jgi:hypothetical protein